MCIILYYTLCQLFKLKPTKTRYASNIHTLDELHKNNIGKFMEKKNNLEDKKNNLIKLKNELNLLENKKFDSNYHIEDTRNKCKIRNEIQKLEEYIIDIENDTSEIEYYK